VPLRVLTCQDLVEIIDLYMWGARMTDIAELYGLNRSTLKEHIKRRGVPRRPPHRAPLATPSRGDKIKSTRPPSPSCAVLADDAPTPDQLLRSSAHAQRDRRTVRHP
jgi:hypothetical protein